MKCLKFKFTSAGGPEEKAMVVVGALALHTLFLDESWLQLTKNMMWVYQEPVEIYVGIIQSRTLA